MYPQLNAIFRTFTCLFLIAALPAYGSPPTNIGESDDDLDDIGECSASAVQPPASILSPELVDALERSGRFSRRGSFAQIERDHRFNDSATTLKTELSVISAQELIRTTVPKRPYNDHNIPDSLKKDPSFKHNKWYADRFSWATNASCLLKYVCVLGLGTCVIYPHIASSEPQQEAVLKEKLEVPILVLAISNALAQLLRHCLESKATVYKERIQGLFDHENLKAGLPIQHSPQESVDLP